MECDLTKCTKTYGRNKPRKRTKSFWLMDCLMINCESVAKRLARCVIRTGETDDEGVKGSQKTARINTSASTTLCHVDIRLHADKQQHWKQSLALLFPGRHRPSYRSRRRYVFSLSVRVRA